MNAKPVVFTTQLTEMDLADAERLGSVLQIPIDLYRPNLTPAVKMERVVLVAACLDGENPEGHTYNPFSDYLMLLGDPANIGLVFHLAAQRASDAGCNSVMTLRWDRQRSTYIPTEVLL